MLEAGPWSYVVKLLFLNTSSILAHDSSLFSLSFSLLNSFFLLLLLSTFFSFLSRTFPRWPLSNHATIETPLLCTNDRSHTEARYWWMDVVLRKLHFPLFYKKTPPRESRTRLASEFLLVDLIRRCIGGVQNGAVEDWNWSGFVVFFYPPTCLSWLCSWLSLALLWGTGWLCCLQSFLLFLFFSTFRWLFFLFFVPATVHTSIWGDNYMHL